jgi:excinuclease UvrABC ATPase subunit
MIVFLLGLFLIFHEHIFHGQCRSHDNNETESRSQNLKETEESPIINNKTEKTSNFKNKTERKFKCTFTGCEKLFRDSYNLRTHLAIHSGMKGTTCPYCSFKCVQKTSLNWHLKSKHNK